MPPLRSMYWGSAGRGPSRDSGMPGALCRSGLQSANATLGGVLVTVAAAAVMMPPAFFLLVHAMLRRDVSSIPAVMVAVLVFNLSHPLALRFMPRAGWRHWREYISSRGYCPSCGYALVNLPEQADGCRVCAECGGAWRVRS